MVHTFLAEFSVWETEAALFGLLVPAAVPGVDFVLSCGDGLLGATDDAGLGFGLGLDLILAEKVGHLDVRKVQVFHGVVGHVLDLSHTYTVGHI